jgi:hypothetical protein
LDLEAELLESTDETIGHLRAVTSVEVISTEVVVLSTVAEHVVGGREHGGGDGQDGLLGSSTALEAEELRTQIAVALTRRRPGGLDVVMDLCGWKTRAMFDRYNITSARDLAEGVKRLGAYLSDSLPSATDGLQRRSQVGAPPRNRT